MANVYLHFVLDEWFENEVKPRLKGQAFEIRYADDGLLCFERQEDAEKVLAVLPERSATGELASIARAEGLVSPALDGSRQVLEHLASSAVLQPQPA